MRSEGREGGEVEVEGVAVVLVVVVAVVGVELTIPYQLPILPNCSPSAQH